MNVLFLPSMMVAMAAITFGLVGRAHAQVDPAQSKVSAVARQMNVPTEGVFRKFTAQIKFDPDKAAQGNAQVTIDVGSYDLGDTSYNDQVAGKEWFDAKDFPQAIFVSTAIVPTGGNHYNVTGKLTIKGKTVPVTVPVTVTRASGKQIFDGTLPIKRLVFDIGTGAWKDTSIVADDVQIKFHLVAVK
ncbi:YceI family protein [Paraburkholderia heleia]|uniref:YceI family protein n=1 Tax=Paraburkholderia heleia TaxID=634127 RepID=UPI0005A7078B|nr:YceI family protein [Paraburkholderia heleia]